MQQRNTGTCTSYVACHMEERREYVVCTSYEYPHRSMTPIISQQMTGTYLDKIQNSKCLFLAISGDDSCSTKWKASTREQRKLLSPTRHTREPGRRRKRTMRFLPAILLLVGALAHRQPGVYHADRQIEWLREHGGFFSEKIQFQRLNTSNTDSPMGIFAVEDIGEKETIMVIPHECLLTSEGSYDMCDTTRNLVKQRKLGNASKFAPYVDYVFDEKHKGHLPSAWSQEGKTFIETILGDHLPPDGIADISFEANCGGSGDPLEEEAYLSVLRRGWEDIMVPVYDMINHRNGKWFNTDSTSVHRGNDITVFTTREVQAGEQLYLSYNECIDCEGYGL